MKKALYLLLLFSGLACESNNAKNIDEILANGSLEELQALKKIMPKR